MSEEIRVSTIAKAEEFLRNAPVGALAVYHKGHMASDAGQRQSKPINTARRLAEIFREAAGYIEVQDSGRATSRFEFSKDSQKVVLTQRRFGEIRSKRGFEYLARKVNA